MVPANLPTQYATESNLAARQRLWTVSRTEPVLDFHGWVLDLARIGAGDRVVEVGCGNGYYLERVEDAVGIDLSPGMLAAARQRTRGPLVCGDAQALPLADGAFDVVLAPHMLYHVPDRRQAARELRRVLRRGGVCIATTNSDRTYAEMSDLVDEVVGGGFSWRRAASAAFSLENGAEQLRAAFAEVEVVEAPRRVVHVTDAGAFTDYLTSVEDLVGGHVDGSWADVVVEARRRVVETIERDGAFLITMVMGAFVCR